MTAKLRALTAFIILLICIHGSFAQESSLTRITVHLKDKSNITGTVLLLNSNQLTLIDDADKAMKNIPVSRIASIEFIEANQTSSSTSSLTVKPESTSMRCGTTPVPVPEVRGFRYGMTYEEFLKLPVNHELVGDPDELGVRDVSLSRISLGYRNEQFKGLERVRLKFIDDRVVDIEIEYDNSVHWENELEFTAAIADALKLPRQGWRGRNPTYIFCDVFTVETDVGYINGGNVRISKLGFEREIAARRRQYEQKRRQTFKP